MPAYPIVLTNLDRVRVVVVGGGNVAERKVAGLIAGGARPVVISPDSTTQLACWHDEQRIDWVARRYVEGDLAGAFLVIAATNDRAVNALVAAEARQCNALINVGDEPAEGNVTTTATVRRGDLLLAATTNGASPSLTARIRRELEAQYGEEYASLLALLREVRSGSVNDLTPPRRSALLRQLAGDEVLEWMRAGEIERVWQLVHAKG